MNDCSWCAAEQGLVATDSPTICARHEAEIMRQLAERQAAKEASSCKL